MTNIDSPIYITLLVCISSLYYLPIFKNIQNFILLISSTLFYIYFSAGDVFPILSIVFIVIFFNNFIKKDYAIATIIILIIFFYFKYRQMSTSYLPIGLSFITFQVISLLEDRRRVTYSNEDNITQTLLYTLYFPQIAAGPIERANHLIDQFKKVRKFHYHSYRLGIIKISFGIIKKTVIANALWEIIKNFQTRSDFSISEIILLPVICRYFIFSNFSSYTDIALGTSSLFGIKLTENFNFPFRAKTLTEFWTKWHITLSNWIKIYLFFPLALEFRRRNIPAFLVIIISFLFIGVWHGLTGNFILYGLIQGLIISFESILNKKGILFYKRINFFNYIYRYFVIFAPSMLFFFNEVPKKIHSDSFLLDPEIKIILIYIVILEVIMSLNSKHQILKKVLKRKWPLRWIFYISLISIYFFLGNFNKDATFLYFNF